MLKYFLRFKRIVNDICENPEKIVGLTEAKMNKLHTIKMRAEDWHVVDCLLLVLEPLCYATNLLSGRSYPTLSTSKAVENILVSRYDSLKRPPFCKIIIDLSDSILDKIRLYFTHQSKISLAQRKLMLVIY